jgi:putative acetyltransferase
MQLEYVKYTVEELEEVKNIFIEYSEFLQVDLCFQNFEKELQTLHQVYSPPQGCIILAKRDSKILGCIALKPIAEGVCEMKRLYVRPEARGLGLGRKLVEEVIRFAQKSDIYKTMKLDTLSKLKEAISLYRSYGFVETTPYVYNPLSEVLYFELKL